MFNKLKNWIFNELKEFNVIERDYTREERCLLQLIESYYKEGKLIYTDKYNLSKDIVLLESLDSRKGVLFIRDFIGTDSEVVNNEGRYFVTLYILSSDSRGDEMSSIVYSDLAKTKFTEAEKQFTIDSKSIYYKSMIEPLFEKQEQKRKADKIRRGILILETL